jgi:hypothetical protein
MKRVKEREKKEKKKPHPYVYELFMLRREKEERVSSDSECIIFVASSSVKLYTDPLMSEFFLFFVQEKEEI